MALSVVWLWIDTDSRTRGLLLTTLELSLAVIVCSVPCGVLLAVLISRTDVFGRRIAGAILTTMLFVPLYLQAAGWDAGFGRQGWLTLSSESFAQPLLTGMRAAIWIHTLAAIPWVMLLVGVALRHVDPELEESALLDCSAPAAVWRVTLPMVLPAIAAAMLWVLIITAGEITVTDLYQVRTFAEEVYNTVPLLDESSAGEPGSATLPRGTGASFALLVAGLILAGAIVRQPISVPARPAVIFSLGIWRIPATVLLAIAVLAIAGVSLANLGYNAGMRVEEVAGQITRDWSAAKAASMLWLTPRRFSSELSWSAVIGAVSATVSVAIAIPLAWFARRGGWHGWPALSCVAVGAALPGPILGLWIIRLLNRPDVEWVAWLYDHSILAPVAATTVRALPAAILVSWYGIQSLPQDLLDAAAVDGLGPLARLLRVVAPVRWRILLAAWLMSFVVAAGDLSASILVTPPGLFTAPVRVFGLLHAGVDDQVAGLCLTNVGVIVVIQFVLAMLFRSRRDAPP